MATTRHRTGRQGYTLVEVVVATLLGLIVVLALGRIVLSNQRSWTWGRDKARLQQDMSQALEEMNRSVRKARWITVPDSNQFRVFDENGVRRTSYTRLVTNGIGSLRQGDHQLVPAICTRFRVQPNADTTSVTLTLQLQDANGSRMVGRTTATVRNRTLAF